MFPRQAVGSVIGFAGMCGAIGGMAIAKITGYVLETTGSYVVIFLIAALAYLLTLLTVHMLVPGLEPVRLDSIGSSPPERP
jgi:ACS family hexuronate transporter-like MFS transporter